MKIDRLIGILSILLQRETVTAPYLAAHFEVSRRTINRDIEDLCKAGKDFRLFKLNRSDNLRLSETVFVKQSVSLPDLTNEHAFPGGIHVKALFDAGCKWRLVEAFGPHCFVEQADKTLLFYADYTDKENLITWILTFREKVKLLEPEEIRNEIQQIIEKMKERYL